MYKPAVAFFGFNRPDCTKIVFEEIRRYRPDKLFLVADGPAVPADKVRCEEVREIIKSVDWECEVKTNFSEVNLGCKKRMSSGIDWVFFQVEEAIFLEDDCVPSPEFFKFCSEMLARYRDNPQVAHIAGANFQAGKVRGGGSYYFSKFIHSWGWASWRRAWQHYDVTLRSWPQVRQENWISKFLSNPIEREYWSGIFDQVHAGKIDTWDYQWAYACWRQNGIGIIPNVNLITNIGAGPDATHTKGAVGSLEIPAGTFGELRHPQNIMVDRAADQFTFDEHCGGNELRRRQEELRRERKSLMRVRRKLSKIKYKITANIPSPVKRRVKAMLARASENEGNERKRLEQMPRYVTGQTQLFGRTIEFVDACTYLLMYNELFERQLYRFETASADPLIIDGGANIGLSSIYFKRLYPESKVIAFEADPVIFEVLRRNCSAFGLTEVELVRKALWGSETVLSFQPEGSLAGRICEGNQAGVGKAVETRRLRDYLQRPVALLKLDIEGAETEVLRDCADLLTHAEHIFVEHHSFLNRPQDLHIVINLLQQAGFRLFIEAAAPAPQPLVQRTIICGMDVQLNIFGFRA